VRYFALLILVWAAMGYGVSFTGFADTYLASRMNDGEWNSLRSRLRLDCSSSEGSSWFFASVNAEKNHIAEENTGVELREAWFEYAGTGWDFRGGRQIIKWGNTDGIPITDVICPGDYSEYITRDFDDIRMPVDALQFRLLPRWGAVELLWLPVFQPGTAPLEGSPWAVESGIPPGDVIDEILMPDKSLANSELAARISLYAPGMDLALSAFHTRDDQPVFHRYVENGTVHWEPRYHSLDFIGGEMSLPLGETVLRGEAAFFQGKRFFDEEAEDRIVKKDLFKGLLGLDWYPGGYWTVSVQIADRLILDYGESIYADEHRVQGTVLISRQFLRQTLEIKNMTYAGFDDGDVYDQISLAYNLTDAMEISGGADLFLGPEESVFGQYEDNTQVWMKLKYSF
jgi:hypothetical protein